MLFIKQLQFDEINNIDYRAINNIIDFIKKKIHLHQFKSLLCETHD